MTPADTDAAGCTQKSPPGTVSPKGDGPDGLFIRSVYSLEYP